MVARFRPEVRLTARQDVLLAGHRRGPIARRRGASSAGRRRRWPRDLTPVRRLAVACPALPTCGQALAEAERVMPDVVDDRRGRARRGSGSTSTEVDVRMTGCPNGCARPYTAEIGIVGPTKRGYDLYVGGAPGGDRLAGRLAKSVKLDDVVDTLRPLLER